MKWRIGSPVRGSLGFVTLTLITLFAGDWLGLGPRAEHRQIEHRKYVGESLAGQLSSLARPAEQGGIRAMLNLLVESNEDIGSIAFRPLEGDGGVIVGEHEQFWKVSENGKFSTLDGVFVPLFDGDQYWGSIELRFREHETRWYFPVQASSMLALILFSGSVGFPLYVFFLRLSMREFESSSQIVPERANAAFDALAEGVLILDEQGKVVLANQAFTDSAALKQVEILGCNANDLNWSSYQTDSTIRPERLPWSRVMESGENLMGEKLTMYKDSNLERSFTVNSTPIHDGKDTVRGAIITFDDLTELEKKNEALKETLSSLKKTQSDVNLKNKELQYLATRDPLTSCLNRRSFTEQFNALLEQAMTHKTELVCIMVDIDHFKRVNDTYGHAVGDKVIKFVADVLKKQIRREDLLGRYGGEEFCIILDVTDLDQAVIVAERMRKEITTGDPGLFTSSMRVTASFGLASTKSVRNDKDQLIVKADRALYLAKESGRNKIAIWEDEIAGQVTALNTKRGRSESIGVASESELEVGERIAQLEFIAQEKSLQLDRYASHDPLTQLPERNLFVDRVEQALLQARRSGRVVAVLSLGLKNLNRVNDTLGHESAQELLYETSERLKEVLRGSDTIALLSGAESETSISKLNGGEFGLLFPAVQDIESITWIVKRIFDALQEPLFINEHNVTVTSNIGIGVYPSDGNDAVSLIKNASISRYYAEQQKGSNNVEYYSEDINRTSQDQLNLESEMSGAIDREEFELVYQPKIDLRTGQIVGFESLIRWNHPVRGLLTPNEFIDIAERTRLINLIGDWVLRASCLQNRELQLASSCELTIAVNLSPVQFSQVDLAERIFRILDETGMKPENLELELTESCLMEDMELTHQILSKLQDHGVLISIDDFGTGYSGLSHLRALPIDIVKIDRSFVAEIGSNEDDTAIVTAVVNMARALDLKVVAEGVETGIQLLALKAMNCDEAQGYYFSQPLSGSDARNFLRGSTSLSCVGSNLFL
ncbi:MAG: diguanylate cyclase (GGDEF)-like protein/PAS domain S-box-containing protein [Halioglobus sp.]|jgi:diguanylate cyclase (GGDEF)-like protein/PAS domain S-box-containing protein